MRDSLLKYGSGPLKKKNYEANYQVNIKVVSHSVSVSVIIQDLAQIWPKMACSYSQG